MGIFIKYEETKTGGEVCKGQEGYSWPDHEPEYIDWRITDVTLTQPDWNYEHREHDAKPGDTVHVVVVRYTTGCTFGTIHGYWHIEGVFGALEEAEKRVNAVYANLKNPRDFEGPFEPWKGYFESFEDCYVESFEVQP